MENIGVELDPNRRASISYLYGTLVGTSSQCFLIAHFPPKEKRGKGKVTG